MSSRYVVIGAGIVGLATAYRIAQARPDAVVTVLEKESGVAAHQSGHNSGVIHAGVYYQPGSLKARLSRVGSRSMVDFCAEHGIPVRVCGKLIVATAEGELGRLRALYERALANGLEVRLLGPQEAREYEPHVEAVAAIHVATTGITNFGQVCRKLAELLVRSGGTILLSTRVTGLKDGRVFTTGGEVEADVIVNCAGLYADRIARLAGIDPQVRILPFRGEYYELKPDNRELVRGLIYPVPDAKFPFLGVHFTKMIDGTVHAGPNAVPVFRREAVIYPGSWRLAWQHWRYGWEEIRRSLSKRRFTASLARLVPEVTMADLVPTTGGVRAQAVTPQGKLVDDFLIVTRSRQVHVLNAPSPAATSSLEIAKYLCDQLP